MGLAALSAARLSASHSAVHSASYSVHTEAAASQLLHHFREGEVHKTLPENRRTRFH